MTKTSHAKRRVALPRVRRGNAEDAQRMRAAMTETALTLFSEGGLDAVSMRGLSARLNISAMTPYHYFADKAELLSALWQHVLKDLYAAVSQAIEAHVGARARLRAYIDAFLLYYETHPDEYRLVFLTQHAAHQSEKVGAEQASIFVELREPLSAYHERVCGRNRRGHHSPEDRGRPCVHCAAWLPAGCVAQQALSMERAGRVAFGLRKPDVAHGGTLSDRRCRGHRRHFILNRHTSIHALSPV